jgi:transcriptional regulator ATRX
VVVFWLIASCFAKSVVNFLILGMGLGKTLQTITFLHTVMTHPIISKTIRRVIIVCPKNVILNWEREFQKWLFENDSTMPEINVLIN